MVQNDTYTGTEPTTCLHMQQSVTYLQHDMHRTLHKAGKRLLMGRHQNNFKVPFISAQLDLEKGSK